MFLAPITARSKPNNIRDPRMLPLSYVNRNIIDAQRDFAKIEDAINSSTSNALRRDGAACEIRNL